eukprot:3937074-Rhodomonas_salina.1
MLLFGVLGGFCVAFALLSEILELTCVGIRADVGLAGWQERCDRVRRHRGPPQGAVLMSFCSKISADQSCIRAD